MVLNIINILMMPSFIIIHVHTNHLFTISLSMFNRHMNVSKTEHLVLIPTPTLPTAFSDSVNSILLVVQGSILLFLFLFLFPLSYSILILLCILFSLPSQYVHNITTSHHFQSYLFSSPPGNSFLTGLSTSTLTAYSLFSTELSE